MFTAWLVLFLDRSGLREKAINWLDKQDKRLFMLIADAIECDFCFCWWINVVLAVLAALIFTDGWLLALMFVNTPISKKML